MEKACIKVTVSNIQDKQSVQSGSSEDETCYVVYATKVEFNGTDLFVYDGVLNFGYVFSTLANNIQLEPILYSSH